MLPVVEFTLDLYYLLGYFLLLLILVSVYSALLGEHGHTCNFIDETQFFAYSLLVLILIRYAPF